MPTATFSGVQARFLYLIGETDTTAITDIHKSHINYAVRDVLNAFPFSWSVATTTITLSSGAANLPSDLNPKWGILDARIVNSSSSDDNIFTRIPISDRDSYTSDDYVYWITYNTTSDVYVFNSLTQTGTVTIYYYFIPTDMSSGTDVCLVPDAEAVAYLAASKNWIGDERNVGLKQEYEKEAASRVQQLYNQDQNFGEKILEYSKISDNSDLTQAGV